MQRREKMAKQKRIPIPKYSIAQTRNNEKKLLEKKCKIICSRICRNEWDGKCVCCGREGSQAHHFFGWKICSNVRFDTDNLAWLCYTCHIYKVHAQGNTEPVREAIIKRIGNERFEDLRDRAFIPKKITLEDMQDIYDNLLQRSEANIYKKRKKHEKIH